MPPRRSRDRSRGGGAAAGPSPKPSRTYPGCDELDVAICALLEGNPAVTNAEIGEQVGLERHAVAARRRKPQFVEMFQARNLPASDILAAAEAVAAKVLVSLLGDPDHSIRERVAARILKRRLVGPGDDEPASGGPASASASVSVPLGSEAAARLAAFIRSGGGVDGPGGGGTPA